jgi:hypothetical protein
MKRSLDENKNNKNEKIINFYRQDPNEEKDIIIKKTNKQEIDEINDLLNDILEEETNIDVVINIDTRKKEICINENINEKEKNRKYKYGNKKLESMIDIIYDDFMYKDINSLILYLNNQNLFVDKKDWRNQLFNEVSYIKVLEEEDKKENELINLLEKNMLNLEINGT